MTELKSFISTPDALDMLITAKNHDLKTGVMADAAADDWLFALVTLQTMEGFLGAGNYGVSRMNGGFANRSAITLAPPGGAGAWVRRDIGRLLALRTDVLKLGIYAPEGIGLVWLQAWDGIGTLKPGQLDPFYVEICRRVRLVGNGGQIAARTGGSKAARIVPTPGGLTGDPWAPIVIDKAGERKVLTVDAGGFSYRRMVRLMFGEDIIRAPLQEIAADDAPEGLQIVARALVRGQGKTEGYHERRVPLSKRVRRGLREGDAEPIARAAQERVALAGEIQSRMLKTALLALFENGPDKVNYQNDGADRRTAAFLARFDEAVDRNFFPHLWAEFDAADPTSARTSWVRELISVARGLLAEADRAASKAVKRRYRAQTRAEAVFWTMARTSSRVAPHLSEIASGDVV